MISQNNDNPSINIPQASQKSIHNNSSQPRSKLNGGPSDFKHKNSSNHQVSSSRTGSEKSHNNENISHENFNALNLNDFTRSDFILLAKLAEQTERFDEMIGFVKKFVSMSSSLLSLDERYYFTTAYKNSVGNRRAELRLLTSIELKEQRNQNKTMLENLKKYKKKIEDELTELCKELIQIIDDKMLPFSKNPENEIYYKKMKADYMR